MFLIESEMLKISRWSGDALLEEIRARFGDGVAESLSMKNFINKARIGMVASYSVRHNFAIVRER